MKAILSNFLRKLVFYVMFVCIICLVTIPSASSRCSELKDYIPCFLASLHLEIDSVQFVPLDQRHSHKNGNSCLDSYLPLSWTIDESIAQQMNRVDIWHDKVPPRKSESADTLSSTEQKAKSIFSLHQFTLLAQMLCAFISPVAWFVNQDPDQQVFPELLYWHRLQMLGK